MVILSLSRRIYDLSREVIEFQRATHPLGDMLRDLQRRFRQVPRRRRAAAPPARRARPHRRVVERADSFRALLQNALTVQPTLLGQRQNEEMRHLTEASLAQNEEVKKISAWAAILFAPTLVGTIYGMNFDDMPELHWQLGYPLALLLMVGTRRPCTWCSNAAAGCSPDGFSRRPGRGANRGHVRNRDAAAAHLVEMLHLNPAVGYGPFAMVRLGTQAILAFADTLGRPRHGHFAFLVDPADFEQIRQR